MFRCALSNEGHCISFTGSKKSSSERITLAGMRGGKAAGSHPGPEQLCRCGASGAGSANTPGMAQAVHGTAPLPRRVVRLPEQCGMLHTSQSWGLV